MVLREGQSVVLKQDYFLKQFKTYRSILIFDCQMFDSDEDRDPSQNPFHHINNADSIFESYCSPAIFLEEQPRESSNSRTTKTRKIHKQKQARKQTNETSQLEDTFGRPPNKDSQKQHLQESRSLNDVLYHYARALIFLKLKQGKSPSVHSLHLQNEENKLMSQTQQIMSKQTFPSMTDTPPTFSLHSNSLHFVFKYHRQLYKKKKYASSELRIMFLAFLKKKKILSSPIYEYVNNYWADIIHLVTHPEGDFEIDSEVCSSELSSPIKGGCESGPSGEKVSQCNQQQIKSEGSGSGGRSRSRGRGEVSEVEQMRRELQEDDTIIAYQIASYLHACCKKFRLFIQQYK